MDSLGLQGAIALNNLLTNSTMGGCISVSLYTFHFFLQWGTSHGPMTFLEKACGFKTLQQKTIIELHLKCKNLRVCVVCYSLMSLFSCFFKHTQHVFSPPPIMIILVPGATLVAPSFGAQDCIMIIC
jgi:hypothetical protein